jgi:hypothetical protein
MCINKIQDTMNIDSEQFNFGHDLADDMNQ